MTISGIFIGLLMIAAGIATLKYNYQVVNSFGRNNWFERNLGSGSSYAVFKLLSLLVILFGFLSVIGVADNLMNFILSPLTNIFKQN